MRRVMKPETLAILCNPHNHEPLQYVREPTLQEWLVGVNTGQRFPIQYGIPVFVTEQEVTGSNKKYQTFYDRIARGYDLSERIVGDLFWGGRDRVRRAILEDVTIHEGDCVLEVSIGTGTNLRYLPEHARYVGLDLSIGMLRQCQRNLQRWKRDAELVQGLAERLPFRDAVFDVVLHFGGINYFNDKAGAILEMVRVARSGARLFIGDETEELARQYERSPLPFFNQYYRADSAFTPLGLVPPEMVDVNARSICKFYMLSFVKP